MDTVLKWLQTTASKALRGVKQHTSVGQGYAAVFSLLPIQVCIDQVESPVCAQTLLTGDRWTPSSSLEALKGGIAACVSLRSMERMVKV